MRRLPLALALVLVMAGCDLNPLDEHTSGGGGGGGGDGGQGFDFPGPPIPPYMIVFIHPSGMGSGRITIPAAPGFGCTFAHEVVRKMTPSGVIPGVRCYLPLPSDPQDSLILVAEPVWFSSFGEWSAGCQPADQPTCTISPAAIEWVWVPPGVGRTGEVDLRFELTGTAPLTAVSGNDQYGTPGNALALPVVVQLRDSLDNPVINEALEFESDEPDAVFAPATGTTDANGEFSTTWILGSRLGEQRGRASASSESLWYATLELRATVVSGGTMTVSTQTVGTNPDTDGYQLVVDGGSAVMSLGANGTRFFTSLPAGDRHLELLGIAANCQAHQNPRMVTIQLGVPLQTDFLVMCQGGGDVSHQLDLTRRSPLGGL